MYYSPGMAASSGFLCTAAGNRLLFLAGCVTEEEFSCLEVASVECGEGVFCPASEVCDYEDKDDCKDGASLGLGLFLCAANGYSSTSEYE